MIFQSALWVEPLYPVGPQRRKQNPNHGTSMTEPIGSTLSLLSCSRRLIIAENKEGYS